MEGIVLPGNARSIAVRAFADCPWLFDVYIPDSVTSIADDAFSGSPYVCILCPKGSYAASYANRLKLPYEITEAR